MVESIRTREARLRRAAQRRGLRLEKSRQRDPRGLVFGSYQLVNIEQNAVVASNTSTGYGLSLDEIERELTS
jgi:hypothetical protein